MTATRSLRAYGAWQHCIALDNGCINLVAALDAGPRILHFGLNGQGNELKVFDKTAPKAGTKLWRAMGGHRFWYTPEKTPYVPDNQPVDWQAWGANGFKLIQKPERASGLQKTLGIRMHANLPRVIVSHRLTNLGRRTRSVGAWGLTVLKPGGEVLLPLPRRGRFSDDVRVAGSLALWPYTDLADKAWRFGTDLLHFKIGSKNRTPQKIGIWSAQGWIAYRRDSKLLVIGSRPVPKKKYPDHGSNVETWAKNDNVELETLGPVTPLRPGQSLEHVQTWSLRKCDRGPSTDKFLLREIQRAL